MKFDVLGTQRAIRDDKSLSTTEKAFLFAATLRTDNGSCKVRASIELIADDMCSSRKTASRVFSAGNENVLKYFTNVERSKRVVNLWFFEKPQAEKTERPENISNEMEVSQELEVISEPQNKTSAQDEAVLEPVAEEPEVDYLEVDDFAGYTSDDGESEEIICDQIVTQEENGGLPNEVSAVLESEAAKNLYLDTTFRADRDEDTVTRARYANDYSYVPVAVVVETVDIEEW